MQEYPLVTVVCPVYNEEKFIVGCVESILKQDYPHNRLEVFFVDGMSNDRTRELLSPYIRQYSFIHLLDNPKRTAPCAMNVGIKASNGEVIVRMDAHAEYVYNYVSVLVKYLYELGADNVGAVCNTRPRRAGNVALAISEVLCNKWGVGNAVFRLGVDSVQEVDTVPFGCWNKKVFGQYGYFDERLTRNQDIELNKRILRGGGTIYLVPGTHSTYYARSTYRELAKNNYANGKWNLLTVRYTRQFNSLSLRHFVPLLFCLSIVLPLLAAFVCPPLIILAGLSLLFYLSVIGGECVRLSSKKHLNFFCLLLAFVVLHFSYGLGSLVGIFERLK